MVFRFGDSSSMEESVSFTQHGVFAMRAYHLVQIVVALVSFVWHLVSGRRIA